MNWRDHREDLKKDFTRDGYVVVEEFMTAAEVTAINKQVDRYISDVLPELSDEAAFYEIKDDPTSIMRLQKMIEHDTYFRDLYYSDPFVELGELLLEDQLVGTNLQWFNKPPRVANATPPHQDGFYFMLEPNEAITLWLAQDEIDVHNGCIRYLPGSHRRGMRPHRLSNVLGFSQGITDFSDVDRAAEVAIRARPGDLLIHHSMLVHRADANPSPRPRRALGFVYYARRAQRDEEKAAAYQRQLIDKWQREGKL